MTTILGIESKTASPSDIYIINYETTQSFFPFNYHNKLYDKSVKVNADKVFRKVYIDPSNLSFYNPIINSGYYDFMVYKNVIKPLLDYKITPHFLRYYRISEGIPAVNYIKELQNIDNTITEQQIGRNLWYMITTTPNRPSINKSYNPFATNNEQFFLSTNQMTNLLINYIDLMVIDSNNSLNLYEYLQANFPPEKPITEDKKSELFIIYFQVLQALYALYLSNTIHNDLHSGNIYVTKRPQSKKIKYNINGQEYNIQTNICIRIYDFDRAYSIRLGNNPILIHSSLSTTFSQNNQVVILKDFIKFYCYINNYFSDNNIPNKDEVLPLTTFLEVDFFKNKNCFLQTADGISIPNYKYETIANFIVSESKKKAYGNMFYTFTMILGLKNFKKLDNVYEILLQLFYANIDSKNKFSYKPDYEYNCDPSFFEGGILKQRNPDCCSEF